MSLAGCAADGSPVDSPATGASGSAAVSDGSAAPADVAGAVEEAVAAAAGTDIALPTAASVLADEATRSAEFERWLPLVDDLDALETELVASLQSQLAGSAAPAAGSSGSEIAAAGYAVPAAAAAKPPSRPSMAKMAFGLALLLEISAEANLANAPSVTASETVKGVETSLSVKVGDGSLETSASLKDGSVTLTTTIVTTLTGNVCPDESGVVQGEFRRVVTTTMTGERAGTDTTTLVSTATAVVGNDAYMQTIVIDGDRVTTRGIGNSRTVTEKVAVNLPGGYASGRSTSTQSATGNEGDSQADLDAGAQNVMDDVIGASMFLLRWQSRWRDGVCVTVTSDLPTTVAPSSATPVAVTVKHAIDGDELPVPVDAQLEGRESLTPPRIPEAPDTFTYAAPPEPDVTSTATFTSTSRRGIGTLKQQVTTKNVGYRVDASWPGGSYRFVGIVCDIEKPFVLQLDGSAVSAFVGPLTVTPTGEGSLAYTFDGTFGGFPGLGNGTGRIDIADDAATLYFGAGYWTSVLPVVGVQPVGPGGQHWANNEGLGVAMTPDPNLSC